jgi:SNF2 family DNA or RNA helicase
MSVSLHRPGSGPTLLPHQVEATERLFRSGRPGGRCLLILPPRLGKTVASVRAAELLGKERILVIAPMSMLGTWATEIEKWDRRQLPLKIAHPAWEDVNPLRIAGWTITNYDSVRRAYKPQGKNNRGGVWPNDWDLIIFDESIIVKNRSAQISSIAKRLVDDNRQAVVWMLSGNPAARYLDELWMQLAILDPKTYQQGYWKGFTHKYCLTIQDMWKEQVVGDQPDGARRMLEDFKHLVYTPNDVPGLTELRKRVENVPLIDVQLKMYLEMEEEFLTYLDGQDNDALLAPNTLAQAIRLMQLVSNPAIIGGPSFAVKWRTAVRLLEGHLSWPVVIWCTFRKSVQLLEDYLQHRGRVASLTGGTSGPDRTRIVDDFQSGKIDLLLAHPAVGRFGLNLSNANSVLKLERTWNADYDYQSDFRVRHLYRTRPVEVVDVLAVIERKGKALPTIDTAIYHLLQSHTGSSEALTAGRLKQAMRIEREY